MPAPSRAKHSRMSCCGRRFVVDGEECPNSVALCGSDAQDAQPMMVPEIEARELLRQLVPQAPHTEITFVDVDIMEQHDRAVGQLGAPSVEIMPDGVIGMESVDMQQVDRAIGEIGDGRIEGSSARGAKISNSGRRGSLAAWYKPPRRKSRPDRRQAKCRQRAPACSGRAGRLLGRTPGMRRPCPFPARPAFAAAGRPRSRTRTGCGRARPKERDARVSKRRIDPASLPHRGTESRVRRRPMLLGWAPRRQRPTPAT